MTVLLDKMDSLPTQEAKFVADCLTKTDPIKVAKDLDLVPLARINAGTIVLPNSYEAYVARNLDKKNPNAPFTMILTKEGEAGKMVSADRELHVTDTELMKSMATGMTFNELSAKLHKAAKLPRNIHNVPNQNALVVFDKDKHMLDEAKGTLEPEVTTPVTLPVTTRQAQPARPIAGTETRTFVFGQDGPKGVS